MFPDFYEPIDPAAVTYIDDIKIIYDESINPPPPPTSLVYCLTTAQATVFTIKAGQPKLRQVHWFRNIGRLPDYLMAINYLAVTELL
jgi:hypothetical protein